MSRKPTTDPAGYFRSIVRLIESIAPDHKSGWWNLNIDGEIGLTKRHARELYSLARLGLRTLREPMPNNRMAKWKPRKRSASPGDGERS